MSEHITFRKDFIEVSRHNIIQYSMWNIFDDMWKRIDILISNDDEKNAIKQNLFNVLNAWEADHLEAKRVKKN